MRKGASRRREYFRVNGLESAVKAALLAKEVSLRKLCAKRKLCLGYEFAHVEHFNHGNIRLQTKAEICARGPGN